MKLFGSRPGGAAGKRLKRRDGVEDAEQSKKNGHSAGRRSGAESVLQSIYEFFCLKPVRITALVLAVLGVFGFVTTTAWSMMTKLPELPPVEDVEQDPEPTFDINPPVSPTPVRVAESTPEPVLRKPGCYTFLLCGLDDGDYRTDTIMIGMLDTENNKLNVVSIPRDTMVNVKRDLKKINSAYSVGQAGGKNQGIEQLIAELKTILGFTPDYYALINMKGFVRLVNAVDGVTFDVPMRMHKQLDDMLIDLQKGTQKLNGNQALMLVRWRDYPNGDDYKRMETQQALLKAIAKQVIQVKNVFKLNEFIDIAATNLKTDLKTSEMLAFANELLNYEMEDINFHTLPTTSGKWKSGNSGNLWYEYVDAEKAVELLNDTIYPFTEPLKQEDLDILVLQN